MLRDRYETDQFFIRIQSLASEMDPEMAQIDLLLNDDTIFQAIKRDLAQRYTQTTSTGRPSTPVEVILRMLVLKRLYDWSYEQTEQHVGDSLVLRRFCRLYFESVPDDTVLIRWAKRIQAQTLALLNSRVTTIATQLKLTRGRKLRTDGTVVETNIHYPTDSSLLHDGVRVLSRTLKRAQQVLHDTSTLAKEAFRNRTRSAKRAAQQISRQAQRGQEAIKTSYRRLLCTAQASLCQAQSVHEALMAQADEAAYAVRERLETFLPRWRRLSIRPNGASSMRSRYRCGEAGQPFRAPHPDHQAGQASA